MARLLLAAHDPGAARVLLAGMPELRRRGHELLLTAAGPALEIWRAAGEGVGAEVLEVAAVVTGTSFHADFDGALWRRARDAGRPSAAIVDGWTNLERRFATGHPDLVLLAGPAELPGIRTLVIGQPHLEQAAGVLRRARAGRPANPTPVVAFFSEPVDGDYPGDSSPGYDQHSVFSAVAAALPPGCRLVVQPHPREDGDSWAGADRAHSTAALLAEADLVVGMTSAVLLEAALAGIPTLAVQPGRTRRLNPVLEDIATIPVVTEPDDLAARLATMVAVGQGGECPLAAVLDGSTRRFADAIDALCG